MSKLTKTISGIYPVVYGLDRCCFQKRKFKITNLDLDLTKEGWLRIWMRWNSSSEDSYVFKYVTEDCRIWMFNENRIYLKFNVPKTVDMFGDVIEVGIRQDVCKKLDFDYKFLENLKYGVRLWFAPKSFNDGVSDKLIYSYDKEKEKHGIQI